MNGMVPYVDFTDSKGPSLWLIYGIGYLLSLALNYYLSSRFTFRRKRDVKNGIGER